VVVGVNTYSSPSQLRIGKTQAGQEVASGQVAPAYYSPHIANLIQAVNTVTELKNLHLTLSGEACDNGEGGTSTLMISLTAFALVVAIGAASLAIFRRREVVRVVESYSAWVHRKGLQPGAKRSQAPGAGRPRPPAAQPTRVRPAAAPTAVPTEPGTAASGDWRLSGVDTGKNAVSLTITPAELEEAAQRTEGGLVLGRSSSLADKLVDDPSVSRRHLKLLPAEDGLAVEDLKSAYGTKVNGFKLEPFEAAALRAGDQIEIGGVALRLSRG
jgi:hypothetical protein